MASRKALVLSELPQRGALTFQRAVIGVTLHLVHEIEIGITTLKRSPNNSNDKHHCVRALL